MAGFEVTGDRGEMTNIISNSIVVIDASTNGDTAVGMVNMGPIYAGVAVMGVVIVSLVMLLVWLKKSK